MLKLLLAVKLVAFVILVLFAVCLPSHAKSNTSEITFASHVEGGMHRHEICGHDAPTKHAKPNVNVV